MVEITLSLPEDIAERARDAGLLNSENITRLVAAELERRARAKRFFGTVDRLTSVEPGVTQEEIDAEIAAYRAEKSASRNSDSAR